MHTTVIFALFVIELNSRIKIGSIPEHEIEIPGGTNVRHYIYGADSRKNKFYACIPPARKKKIDIYHLFKAFGAKYDTVLFRSHKLIAGCFCYNSGAEGIC